MNALHKLAADTEHHTLDIIHIDLINQQSHHEHTCHRQANTVTWTLTTTSQAFSYLPFCSECLDSVACARGLMP
jgi:hypothetical protein